MNTPDQTPSDQTPSEQTPPEQAALPQVDEAYERLRAQQSLPLGAGAGLVAALIGAVIWAAITFFTEYQIGWMAIGVGFLVGYAVRFGRGVDPVFKIVGAVLALFGCVLGNVFTIYAFAAKQVEVSVFEVAGRIDFSTLVSILQQSFSPMDLLFYGLAVYEGWRFATIPVPVNAPPPEAA